MGWVISPLRVMWGSLSLGCWLVSILGDRFSVDRDVWALYNRCSFLEDCHTENHDQIQMACLNVWRTQACKPSKV
jgi:hypothetical protein